MISVDRVKELVTEMLTEKMFIVELNISANNSISVLIDSDLGLSVDKCVEVSRHIEHNLDRESEDFDLEVSSPGLTQPFKVVRQYAKNTGHNIEVVTTDGEKHTGLLRKVESSGIELEVTKKEGSKRKQKPVTATHLCAFAFSQIKTAKCVISFK